MVGRPAAQFINVLLLLVMEPKTDYRRLPNTRATPLFSYYGIGSDMPRLYNKTRTPRRRPTFRSAVAF